MVVSLPDSVVPLVVVSESLFMFSVSELTSFLGVLCTCATISCFISSFWRCLRGRDVVLVLIVGVYSGRSMDGVCAEGAVCLY